MVAKELSSLVFKRILEFSLILQLSLSLTLSVLRNLKDNYDEALARDDVKAIVVTGESDNMLILSLPSIGLYRDKILIFYVIGPGVKGRFSGGFDISALGRPQSGPSMLGVSLCLVFW